MSGIPQELHPPYGTDRHRHDGLEPGEWRTPTFENGWTQRSPSLYPVGYRLETNGIVRFKGVMDPGTDDTVAFTLPEAYRPAGLIHLVGTHAQGTGGTTFTLRVAANGQVTPKAGVAQAWYALDGITFHIM